MVWVGFMCIFRKNLVGLQYVITIAISVGLLEGLLWSFAWVLYNETGSIIDWLNLLGALLTAIKLTFIRTVVLLVSIGYSIIYPTLRVLPKLGVIFLTLIYGTTVGISEYVNILKSMGVVTPLVTGWSLIILLVIFNGLYIFWIAYSLFDNIRTLKSQFKKSGEMSKLEMYTTMAIVLSTLTFLSIAIFSVEYFFSAISYEDYLWNVWWIFGAYWEFLYLFVTLLIAFLWRPNENNLRFDFTNQLSDYLMEAEGSLLSLQPAPPVYSQKEDPSSPVQLANGPSHVEDEDDEGVGSEMDELVL